MFSDEFSGDSSILNNFENSKIITIEYENGKPLTLFLGRPTFVKPYKPLFCTVFKRIYNDKRMSAFVALNHIPALIKEKKEDILKIEKELETLKGIKFPNKYSTVYKITPLYWFNYSAYSPVNPHPVLMRADYLLQKMRKTQEKVQLYEDIVKQSLIDISGVSNYKIY